MVSIPSKKRKLIFVDFKVTIGKRVMRFGFFYTNNTNLNFSQTSRNSTILFLSEFMLKYPILGLKRLFTLRFIRPSMLWSTIIPDVLPESLV